MFRYLFWKTNIFFVAVHTLFFSFNIDTELRVSSSSCYWDSSRELCPPLLSSKKHCFVSVSG